MTAERPFTDDGDLVADDEELRALVVELDDSDPLPEELLTMAAGLYAWRNADGELLELLVDSATQPLPLARSEPMARVIAFGDGARGIHLECHDSGAMIVLKGAVHPAGEHVVIAERIGGADTTRADSFGLFELGPMTAGRIRLIVRTPAGSDVLVTPWFVLEVP
jgi:hypothetical protein